MQQQSDNCHNTNKVTVDMQLLKKKEEILIQYYRLQQQSSEITLQSVVQLLKQWPNESIINSIKQQNTFHRTNNARYVGQICNQMFHGYGLLIYDQPKGRYYQGDFQNNCKHGDGLQFIGGDIYVGKFINNKPEDENGVFMWKNGDIFIGGFINGQKHGMGRWQSGQDYYIGTWKLNHPEGSGKIHTKNSQYQGDIKNGYKHGRGNQIFQNGDTYGGQYANGKPQGDGIYKWNNGAIYKGQFKNGIRYGYGQWTFGKEKYQGQYVNDRRNGQGIYQWGSDSYYKGIFVEDMRHGFGEMHWNQNAFYRGKWKEGIQCGQGQLWEDGQLISKGIFQQGKIVKNSQENPPKLMKSRYQKSSKHDTSIGQNSSIKNIDPKYPSIDKRKKLRSSSYYTNLSKIDEKQPSQRSKKKSVATSFSHHIQKSNKNPISQNNGDPPRSVKQSLYLPQRHIKKNVTPTSALNNTASNGLNKVKSKKRLQNSERKKDRQSYNEKISNPRAEEMLETQLGPIKWKNFRHINGYKNPNANKIPHI